MTIDLSGTTVLVTGASRGIGAAIARALGHSGARIAVHYRTSDEQAQAVADDAGNDSFPIQADLADPDETERLFESAAERLNGIDVLVNNAGVAHSLPLDSSDDEWLEGWRHTIEVNLRAPEQLCRLAVRHLRKRGGGRIINVSSRAAFRGDTPEYVAYAASKGGLVAVTRSIARGCGKDGICAFTIAPGFTRTDMAQPFIEAYGEEATEKDGALNRMTEPEDIAPMIVLLASGSADHATGATIDINAASYVH